MSPEVASDLSGLQLFARYAYPPNERGYCGPEDHMALAHYRESGITDRGLAELAQSFHGPWPYLKMLAERTGVGGPFSRPVVEAYWVGNQLLDSISVGDFGNAVEERFRPRTSSESWRRMAEAIPGGFPHHSFHVFVAYPWVGLLQETHRGEPLVILDQCRIRWGSVKAAQGAKAVVESRPLEWDQKKLRLGDPRLETVTVPIDLRERIRQGHHVSMHWSWVCDLLDERQLRDLRRFSIRQLKITNEELAHPGPAHVIG